MATPKEQERARKDLEAQLGAMVWALARAYRDPIRPWVREQGLEERDLAFEAGLLDPWEVEMPTYATQKRGRIVRLLREMQRRGWVDLEPRPPYGAYYVRLRPDAMEALARARPGWGARLRRWWRALRTCLPL